MNKPLTQEIKRGNESYTVVVGHDLFWKNFSDGSWEPSTFKIFDKFLNPERPMLDIGAWIGPTALYASKRAKKVYAFEPDPVAYFFLIQNLALNKADNVTPYPVAVSKEWGGIPFGTKGKGGDSMSSVLWAKDDSMVPAVSFMALLLDIDPSFIKIDIEGGEKDIFEGSALILEQMKPTIHLSLHTPWMKDVESFKKKIMEGLKMYPYFYNENLQPINLEDAFDKNAFNSVVASFQKI